MKLIRPLLLMVVLFAVTGFSAEPTMGIVTGVDPSNGIVTAKVTDKGADLGRVFKFKVNDRSLLKTLKVGQAVHADFVNKKVSVRLDRSVPCCAIVQ